MDAALVDLLQQTVTIAPYASQNSAGEATYGAPVSYDCLIENRMERVQYLRAGAGVPNVNVLMHAVVYLDGGPIIGQRDEITLPDGSKPVILKVNRYPDLDGTAYVTEVWV